MDNNTMSLKTKINLLRKEIQYKGVLCYIEIELTDDMVLVSLMSSETNRQVKIDDNTPFACHDEDCEVAIDKFLSLLKRNKPFIKDFIF